MADYYTSFSFMLPPVAPQYAEAAKTWLSDWHNRMDDDDWNSYGISLKANGGGFWIHHDGSGDVEAAIEIVQSYLELIDAPNHHGVYFSWANTCSKPRLNSFDGGAAVVTRGDYLIVNSNDVLREAAELGVTIIAE